MYLCVSLDAGIARAVPGFDPDDAALLQEAVGLGTLDVFRADASGFSQLGFDGHWHPAELSDLDAVLAELPRPVMAFLPHERSHR